MYDMGRKSSGRRQRPPKPRIPSIQRANVEANHNHQTIETETQPSLSATPTKGPEESWKNQDLKVKFNVFNVKLHGLKELDIIHACKQVVGRNGLIGVQYIPRTKQWIIYAKDESCRNKLLVQGIDIGGIHVVLNLFSPQQSDENKNLNP